MNEAHIIISLHQLDSCPVYENVSDLQVVTAAETDDEEVYENLK